MSEWILIVLILGYPPNQVFTVEHFKRAIACYEAGDEIGKKLDEMGRTVKWKCAEVKR